MTESTTAGASQRAHAISAWHAAAGLFAFALLFRIGWIAFAGRGALSFSDDAKAYHDLAVNLIRDNRFSTAIDPPHRLDVPYAQRPPLTPFALAAVYVIFGPHVIVEQVFLAILSTLSVVGLYSLGRRLFSHRIGVLAGVMASVYPFFIILAGVPLTETLAMLLYIVLAICLTKDTEAYSLRNAILAGVTIGLAALNRPQIIGFVPFLFLLVLVNRVQSVAKRFKWLGMTLVCAGVIVSPWMIRNRIVVGGWIPISLQGGVVLYEGNNPYTQTALDSQWAGARGWYDDPRWNLELRGLSPLRVDRTASHLAAEFIRDNPLQSFRYSIQKVGLFFSAYAHPVARLSWYPMFALSLLGFYWTAGRWRQLLPVQLLIAQTILTAAIFTSMPRFRAPVEPFFLLMAAYALSRLWERRPALHSTR